MKYVAAYLLAQLGGKASPSADDIIAILNSVGIEADAGRIDALLHEVKGKDVAELISKGKEKLQAVPAGGAAAAPAAAAPAAGAPAKEEHKKEEKKVVEEKKEESDVSTPLPLILFHVFHSSTITHFTGGHGLQSLRLNCSSNCSKVNVECTIDSQKQKYLSPTPCK